MTEIEMRDAIAREHYLRMVQDEPNRTAPRADVEKAGGIDNFVEQQQLQIASDAFDLADIFMNERSKRIGHGRSFIGNVSNNQ